MEIKNLVSQANAMVQNALGAGQIPVVFLMNAMTMAVIADAVAIRRHERKSVLARVWAKLTGRKPAAVPMVLCGIPIQEHPYLPDGALTLQIAIHRPEPEPEPAPPSAEDQELVKRSVDAFFRRREKVEPDQVALPEEDVRPSLGQLSQSRGERPSVSDILIKAMDDVDNLNGIVVVRVHRNGDVDLCLNVNEFEAVGVLQKAQHYLAMRGFQ